MGAGGRPPAWQTGRQEKYPVNPQWTGMSMRTSVLDDGLHALLRRDAPEELRDDEVGLPGEVDLRGLLLVSWHAQLCLCILLSIR